jgi:two-component system phosphate regulon sensor histidine kinase PhoR
MGMDTMKTAEQLRAEMEELRMQLQEANETIHAISTGQVDALIVQGENGHELYTLKSADQTYRMFIEKMNEGAVTLNREGIILYSNSRFADIVNTPLEKVIGVPLQYFIPDEFQKNFQALIARGWQADNKGEVSIFNRAYNLVPYLLSCKTLELDEGLAMSIILTDLTAQKEAQKQLEYKNEELEQAQRFTAQLNDELENLVKERTNELFLSREHFKFLADHIPVIVWTALPDGNLDYFNKRWYDYTGLTFAQSKNMGWKAALHPDDVALSISKWKKAVRAGKPYEMEYRIKNSLDDSYRWYLGYAVPFKSEHSEIVAWFGTNTDIEDQKRAMTRKDEFIGIASHELKTPLTSLKGYLQLINMYKKEPIPADVEKYVSKANEAINKLQYLVNDLLDVSKIQAGKLEYAVKPFSISELLSLCLESANHIYQSHRIVNISVDDFKVIGNIERLEQVIMNLIGNAVKYAKNDEDIIIEAVKMDDMGRVCVTDFGIGLSDAQKELIFDRFYRVEDKKFKTSGLGMGLYISSEIVKTHNGTIGVNSKLGEGSTFYFDLPLA